MKPSNILLFKIVATKASEIESLAEQQDFIFERLTDAFGMGEAESAEKMKNIAEMLKANDKENNRLAIENEELIREIQAWRTQVQAMVDASEQPEGYQP